MAQGSALPTVIAGRYEVLGTLGQGGMGAVYRARDTRLGRVVAIKTILPHLLANQQASARFLREARALALLNHPNVLTLYDSGQDKDVHYLVMEIGGRDLAQLLEAGPLQAERALHISLGVGAALEYAHAQGIVHRDLKPANVLVGYPDAASERPSGARERTSEEPVKVMDFGLAKLPGASTITAPSSQLGTAQYMSPEQIVGREADGRSDLYSFGVVLYELWTGVRPLTARTRALSSPSIWSWHRCLPRTSMRRCRQASRH